MSIWFKVMLIFKTENYLEYLHRSLFDILELVSVEDLADIENINSEDEYNPEEEPGKYILGFYEQLIRVDFPRTCFCKLIFHYKSVWENVKYWFF